MIDTDDKGEYKGMKAIDNDFTFGTKIAMGQGASNSTGFAEGMHMDAEMAKRIQGASEEELQLLLGDLLSKDELKALWGRFASMQDIIKGYEIRDANMDGKQPTEDASQTKPKGKKTKQQLEQEEKQRALEEKLSSNRTHMLMTEEDWNDPEKVRQMVEDELKSSAGTVEGKVYGERKAENSYISRQMFTMDTANDRAEWFRKKPNKTAQSYKHREGVMALHY